MVFLARWLAEVHKDPAPVSINSRLTLPDPLHFSHGAAICECQRNSLKAGKSSAARRIRPVVDYRRIL